MYVCVRRVCVHTRDVHREAQSEACGRRSRARESDNAIDAISPDASERVRKRCILFTLLRCACDIRTSYVVYRAKGYGSREPALDFGSSARSELELERAHHGIELRARCGVI